MDLSLRSSSVFKRSRSPVIEGETLDQRCRRKATERKRKWRLRQKMQSFVGSSSLCDQSPVESSSDLQAPPAKLKFSEKQESLPAVSAPAGFSRKEIGLAELLQSEGTSFGLQAKNDISPITQNIQSGSPISYSPGVSELQPNDGMRYASTTFQSPYFFRPTSGNSCHHGVHPNFSSPYGSSGYSYGLSSSSGASLWNRLPHNFANFHFQRPRLPLIPSWPSMLRTTPSRYTAHEAFTLGSMTRSPDLAFVNSEYPSFVYNPRPIVFPSPIPMDSEDVKPATADCLGDVAPDGAVGGDSSQASKATSLLSGLPNGVPRSVDNDKVLLAPYEYIRRAPGKGIRSKMSLAFNHWLNIPDEKLKLICEIVEMLHNASLIIDDIEDRSVLRRGIPVAHKVFGTASCINSANFIYFLGLEKCLQLQKPEAISIFTEQMLLLHRGQGLDIYWRDSLVCPTEEEYRQMVIWKTGGLFGLAVRLMQLFSEDDRDYRDLLSNLGLLFQIRDDYANLVATEYHDSKTYCEDLTEGKYSFPIVHAIQSHPTDQEVIGILRQRTTDVDVKRYCVRHLHRLGAFAYTRATLVELENEIRQLVERFGGNAHLSLLVSELSKLYKSETTAIAGAEEVEAKE